LNALSAEPDLAPVLVEKRIFFKILISGLFLTNAKNCGSLAHERVALRRQVRSGKAEEAVGLRSVVLQKGEPCGLLVKDLETWILLLQLLDNIKPVLL